MARLVMKPAAITWVIVAINLGVLALYVGVHNGAISGAVATVSGVLSFTVVGALITLRRPAGRIGWLLVATGSVMAITFAASEWPAAAYAGGPKGVPAPVLAAWIGEWLWIPMLAMQFVFLPWLLPSGRPASRRMARVLIILAVVVGGWTVAAMVQGELQGPHGGRIDNPIGMLAINDVEDGMSGGALAATLGLAMTVTGVAVILRYRRSRPVERMQLRWVLLGASASAFGFVVIGFVEALLPMHRSWLDAVVLPIVPISIGVAVSKYRLYEIDRIISRTVSYALLTGSLALLYVGVVGLVQRLAPVDNSSFFGVALSTLLVAGLFQPARRHIQRVVDRRFDRAKYDHLAVTDALRHQVRDNLDLNSLCDVLITAIHSTVHPDKVGIWLRPDQPVTALRSK